MSWFAATHVIRDFWFQVWRLNVAELENDWSGEEKQEKAVELI